MARSLRVGWDLDGVVCQFVDDFRAHVLDVGRLDPDGEYEARSWSFYKDWGLTTEEFLDLFADGVNNGKIFWDTAPYPGALEAINEIADAGHEIIVVTSRTVRGAEKAARDATFHWLDKHEVPYSECHVIGPDKTGVPLDTMIEDNVDNYQTLSSIGIRSTLIDRPWNEHATDALRIRSHEEYVEFVNRVAIETA